ncbi:MAG: hypothetical protein ABEI32_01445 [Halothece sp.]
MSNFNLSAPSWTPEQGKVYLQKMQALALEPSLVQLQLDAEQERQLCSAIAPRIAQINQELAAYLLQCQQCFYPQQRLSIQIFAAPFAQHLNIDGLCNLNTDPITILIDVGRMIPQHWLCAIAHEYTHAQVGMAGHHQAFRKTLTHLCLGLGLTPPPHDLPESDLRKWPPCQPTSDPLAFWLGTLTDRL